MRKQAFGMEGTGTGAATAPRALLATVARLYYEADLSQLEIARRIGVSTATVSRLLRRAREAGIVHIEIRDAAEPQELADRLVAALGLKRAAVVETIRDTGSLASLAAPVGTMLRGLGLGPGSVVAIGWGRTIWEVLQAGLPRLPGVLVVPAAGGMPEPSPHFQNNELMRLAAEQMGGTPHFIHAPYLPSEEARPMLLADPSVREAVALWDRVDVALVGIGLPWAVDRAQGGTAATPADPELAGAAGDVLQRYVDAEGRLIPWTGDRRLVMMTPIQLRRTPLVIGVAAAPAKVAGIVGVVRAGLISALVTDARTAAGVLAMIAQDASPADRDDAHQGGTS